jgi:hypothetical protein
LNRPGYARGRRSLPGKRVEIPVDFQNEPTKLCPPVMLPATITFWHRRQRRRGPRAIAGPPASFCCDAVRRTAEGIFRMEELGVEPAPGRREDSFAEHDGEGLATRKRTSPSRRGAYGIGLTPGVDVSHDQLSWSNWEME